MIQKIESVQNESIKRACKLAVSAKYRRGENAFFLEGVRLCCDAAISGVGVLQCFVTQSALDKESERLSVLLNSSMQAVLISDAVAQKLSQTHTPQGVFCICSLDPKETTIETNGVYLALDHIQDPANLGAMIRTAEALGLSGAVLCGCCDIYNPKAQRAAMGSLLRMPLIETDDLASFLTRMMDADMRVLATTPDASAPKLTDLNLSGGVIVVIGNEGNGVSDDVLSICEQVTIPMNGRAESLNASMAAAITMWELVRKR